jgi:hypothetical protein
LLEFFAFDSFASCAASVDRSSPDCRSVAQHENVRRSVFHDDLAYLLDQDNPINAANAGLVFQLFLQESADWRSNSHQPANEPG